MNDGLRHLIGKRITSVVVGKNSRDPRVQLFLVLSDGTSFEFWGESFSCASGPDSGGVAESVAYIESMGGVVTSVYPGSSGRP